MDLNKMAFSCSKWASVAAWIATLGFFLYVGAKYSEHILSIQAYGGWSPIDWVNHQLLPENFKEDFPSGIAAYRMSSFMHLYLFAGRLGIDLELLVPLAIYFEVLFLGVSSAIFFRALVPKAPYVAMFIFAALVVEGSARSMDLARFGNAFYQGLFYNIACGLGLLGIAFLFRGRLIWAAFTFGVGVTVHPVIVGMALIFAAPYAILVFHRFSLRVWAFAFITFFAIFTTWFAVVFQSAEVTSGGIPSQVWLSLVRTFSFHWFPVDIGVFSSMHTRYILPLLCVSVISILYFKKVFPTQPQFYGVGIGLALLMLLTGAGVLISEYSSEPFLIKLALHRASAMLILVGLLIVVAGLTKEIQEGGVIIAACAAILLISPLLQPSYVFPVFWVLAFITLYGFRSWRNENLLSWLNPFVCFLSLGFVVSAYYYVGLSDFISYTAINPNADRYDTLYIFLFAVVVFLPLYVLRKTVVKGFMLRSFAVTVFSLILLGFALNSVHHKSSLTSAKIAVDNDYLEAQRWARTYTPPTALFMVDPTIYYGWRDFSQRSSFGNLREWLHTSWLYDSQKDIFEEGIRRFNEFGISLDLYLNESPSIKGYEKLSHDIKQQFYQMDDRKIINFSDHYGVDYLVLRKGADIQNYPFEKVFENSNFLIYQIDRQ